MSSADLCTEDEIVQLVCGFHGRVRRNKVLSPVFNRCVRGRGTHMPKIVDPWLSALQSGCPVSRCIHAKALGPSRPDDRVAPTLVAGSWPNHWRLAKRCSGKACQRPSQAHCPMPAARLSDEAGPAPADKRACTNTISAFDRASARVLAGFFLNTSTALGFSPPCPVGAWSGITHQIRNRMKTQTLTSQLCRERKPISGALSSCGCNTGQAAQALPARAGDA